jgi:hypothetical protein
MKRNIKNVQNLSQEKKAYVPKPFIEPKSSKPTKPKKEKLN